MQHLVLVLTEIPLFHVLNARITFENVNGCRTADKRLSQQAGGAQCDSGEGWERAAITSFYPSVSGMHRQGRWVQDSAFASLLCCSPQKSPKPIVVLSQVVHQKFWS